MWFVSNHKGNAFFFLATFLPGKFQGNHSKTVLSMSRFRRPEGGHLNNPA